MVKYLDFAIGGGGLRTVYFCGQIHAIRELIKLPIKTITVFSGSALTVPTYFSNPNQIYTLIDNLDLNSFLKPLPSDDKEALELHGVLEYTEIFDKFMSKIIQRTKKYDIRVVTYWYKSKKRKYEKMTLNTIKDSTRLPAVFIPGMRNRDFVFDGGINTHLPVHYFKDKRQPSRFLITFSFSRSEPITVINALLKMSGFNIKTMKRILYVKNNDLISKEVFKRFVTYSVDIDYNLAKKISDIVLHSHIPYSMVPSKVVVKNLFDIGYENVYKNKDKILRIFESKELGKKPENDNYLTMSVL